MYIRTISIPLMQTDSKSSVIMVTVDSEILNVLPEFDTYRYVTHLVYTHTSIVLENFSNFLREKM